MGELEDWQHVRGIADGRVQVGDRWSVGEFVAEFDRVRRQLELKETMVKALIADLAQCQRERAEARAALAYEISRRCLGGTPPAVDKNWANRGLGAPEPGAEGAAHRRVGMARSDDHLKGSGT